MNMPVLKKEAIRLTIDGRQVQAEPGQFILAVARKAGIDIPTLCDHPDLEPVGACRLCMVEVTHPDWGGWKGLMTACLYPVAPGIEVSTRSPAVISARRRVLSLLAARCPNSEVIRTLAERYGAETTSLEVVQDADNCILCGLCSRVCETYATAAIATRGRGSGKGVGTFADTPPDECVGCGACALVCPTGEIQARRTAQGYQIWDRTIETALCRVDESRCFGCGACEEACPFHVARVALRGDGTRIATIPPEHCRGCGACVGACPSGAISQDTLGWQELEPRLRFDPAGTNPGGGTMTEPVGTNPGGTMAEPTGTVASPRAVVFGCGRANFGAFSGPVDRVELPCVGRITPTLLLAGLARGADGLLVLGRHQKTCRFDGAEDPVLARVDQVRNVAEMLGLGAGRIIFDTPEPGLDGPRKAVEAFFETVQKGTPNPVRGLLPDDIISGENLDSSLAIVEWLYGRQELKADLGAWIQAHGLPEYSSVSQPAPEFSQKTSAHMPQFPKVSPAGVADFSSESPAKAGNGSQESPVLDLELLPFLDILGADLIRPVHISEVVRAALDVLTALGKGQTRVAGLLANGIVPGPVEGLSGRCFTLCPLERKRLADNGIEATLLDDLLRDEGVRLPRPPKKLGIACDGSAAGQVRLVEALGHEAIDVGPDELPDTFAFSPAQRLWAEQRLARAELAGAVALLTSTPRALVRWSILTRQGTWRSSRILPVLGVQLAAMAPDAQG